VTLLDDLRTRRATARAAADEILTRSAESGEPLSTEDAAEHARAVAYATEAGDAIEAYLADQVAELRAGAARRRTVGPTDDSSVLTREQSVDDWCRTRGLYAAEDADDVSFDRWLRGITVGDWSGAEHERALNEGTATAGGHLVPTPLAARVIDLIRNASVVNRVGATTLPMTTSTLKIPKLTGEGTPAWKSEGAAITAVDLTFGSLTFTAQTLVRLVTISAELYEDSDPSAWGIVASSFARQMAVELDRVALLGSGTAPEPRGIVNQSGVTLTDHGANGSNITNYDWWLQAIGTVRAAGFEPTAHVQAPRSSTSLSVLKEATTNAYLTPTSGLLPMLTSKTVPINLTVGTSTDASYVFTADRSQLAIGMRTGFNIRFLDQRYVADTLSYASWPTSARTSSCSSRPRSTSTEGCVPDARDHRPRRPQARGSITGAPLAEVSAGRERPLGSDPRDPIPATDAADYADADVLVARPDLGPDRYTLVLSGDRLPSREELRRTGALLRTDLKSRYDSYKVGIEAGFLTVNEARTRGPGTDAGARRTRAARSRRMILTAPFPPTCTSATTTGSSPAPSSPTPSPCTSTSTARPTSRTSPPARSPPTSPARPRSS
jgi:HK97 family phage major capsid protein